jgi:hypothetical protein
MTEIILKKRGFLGRLVRVHKIFYLHYKMFLNTMNQLDSLKYAFRFSFLFLFGK